MSDIVSWDAEADLYGVRVRAWFVPDVAEEAGADLVGRLLPFLAGRQPTVLSQPGARQICRAGGLAAQPDLLLTHGSGLISVCGGRSAEGRPHARADWPRQLQLDAVLQAVATAMAVAGHHQRPTAALWRGPNVVYQFDPGAAVLECLASHVADAQLYWHADVAVTPAQLASYCEPRLRALPGLGADPVPTPGGRAERLAAVERRDHPGEPADPHAPATAVRPDPA